MESPNMVPRNGSFVKSLCGLKRKCQEMQRAEITLLEITIIC